VNRDDINVGTVGQAYESVAHIVRQPSTSRKMIVSIESLGMFGASFGEGCCLPLPPALDVPCRISLSLSLPGSGHVRLSSGDNAAQMRSNVVELAPAMRWPKHTMFHDRRLARYSISLPSKSIFNE